MPACCPCKSNGGCKSCVCVKSGWVCRDCAAGKAGRCQNHSKHVEHSDVHGITDLLQNRKDETIVEEMLNENTKMETGLSGLNTGLSTLIGEETTNSSQTPNRGEAVPIGHLANEDAVGMEQGPPATKTGSVSAAVDVSSQELFPELVNRLRILPIFHASAAVRDRTQ